jgi:hypothetical protein
MKNYYETQSVGAGKRSYSCDFCGGAIKKGSPSHVHKFYPEFSGSRTHPKCSTKFLAQETCEACCGDFDVKDMHEITASHSTCKKCWVEELEEREEMAKAAEKKRMEEEAADRKKNPLKYAEKDIKEEIAGTVLPKTK